MTSLMQPKSHGLELDYAGLVCRDMTEGADWIAAQTGVSPTVTEPRDGDRFSSAVLRLGPDSVLEVMGPLPQRSKWSPASLLMAGVWPPRVLIWYVATDDFAAVARLAADHDVTLSRVEHTVAGEGSGGSGYDRAQIGRRPRSAVPGIIQWHRRFIPEGADERCQLVDFSVAHPDADSINPTLRALGIGTRLRRGPHRVALSLDSPAGRVTIDQPGFSPTAASVASLVAAGIRRALRGP